MPNKEYLRDHRCEGTNVLTSVKYLRLSLKSSWALVFCIDTHVCTISKVVGLNKEK